MLINKIEVDEGRDIIIMDEAFKFGDHQALYDTCMSLRYSCKNTSNLDIQDITDKRMRADLPQLDQHQIMARDEEGARLRRSLCPECGIEEERKAGEQINFPDDNILRTIYGDPYRMQEFARFIDTKRFYLSTAYVNLGLVNDSHEIHVDAAQKGKEYTMLIYPNIEWGLNHGGETVFYEEDRREIVYINPYKPGRICLFDGSIPHCAKPQALVGPKYRFTIAVKFTLINPEDDGVDILER